MSGIAHEENGVVERVWLLIARLLWNLLKGVVVGREPPFGKYLNDLDARHVEDAAERLGCHHSRAYGCVNAEDDSEDDYEICDETSDNEEEEDDCATLSDAESLSSEISVYSDKDCPDKDN